jgi:TRAP-type C4-dicarboxylate transport system permease large subunit
MCTIGLISPPAGVIVFIIRAQHLEIPVVCTYLVMLPFLAAISSLSPSNGQPVPDV